MFQMAQHGVEGDGYGVLSRSVRFISKLMWIEGGREAVSDVSKDQPFQALSDDRCKGHWTVVI